MKKNFEYICKNCHKKYQVQIDVDSHKVFRLICKNCGYIKIINNTTGILKNQLDTKPKNYSYGSTPIGKQQSKFKPRIQKKFQSDYIKEKLKKFFSLFNLFQFSKSFFILFVSSLLFILFGFFIIFFTIFVSIDYEFYLKELNKNQSNVIYDKEGNLISEIFDKKISTLSYKEIPNEFKQILLFVEDQNFFSHSGIDYKGIVRAIFKNLMSFGYVQGASTITQQLARILLGEREKTITRKLKEAFLAFELEKRFKKEEILTFYINHVYLGHGAYGFQNASQFYFRKNINELNFIEMLVLTSLPSRPEYYSPFRNYDRLEKKINSIYERISNEKPKFYYPTEKEFKLQKEKLKESLNRSPSESVFGTRIDYVPYITEFIRKKIETVLGKEYSSSMGLKVYTTIDKDLQISAAKESYSHLQTIRKFHPYKIEQNDLNSFFKKHYLETGLGAIMFGMPLISISKQELETASIGINPTTGEILFIQGGSSFESNNQFNRAIQMKRQTGSAIKPIIYSAGIEDGIFNPATIFEDSPIYFSLKQTTKGYWLPDNVDETYEGSISLREALEKSRNIPALLATKKIGIDRLAIQFKNFFFHTESEFKKRFKEELAIGIGILEMSPLEMAIAYSVFANNGIIKKPYLIKKITDSKGNILYEGINEDEFNLHIEEKQIISGDTAEVMIDLLKSSAKYGGTGLYSSLLAGKTGTTNEYRDAWFIGILPELVIAIWIGFDNPKISMNKATGATVAGPLYGKILNNVRNKYDKGEYFFSPRAIYKEICPKSGKIPTKFCPRRKTEIFTLNSIPQEECDYHKLNPEEHFEKKSKSDFE